ncbi:MAG: hypothetical protein OCD01_16460 [Fibrobacterales bacterium]
MRLWLCLMVVVSLSSCLNSTDPTESSDSSSTAVLSGSISFTYTVPTANVPFSIDSIACTIRNDDAFIPLSINNPQFSGATIPFEASANVGDSLTLEVELWSNDTLIATALDSAIIEATTTIISGSIVNHLPTIDAGTDRTVYVNDAVTFKDPSVNEPDDNDYSVWWKSTNDSTYTQNSLTTIYKAVGNDTIILLVIDGYGHLVSDTLVVTVIDYEYSVAEPLSSSSAIVVSSSEALSSAPAVSSSSVPVMVSSSSSAVVLSSAAPVTYALTVEGGIGSGDYQAGEAVVIVANANESGRCFSEWTGDNIPDETNDTTTIIMPASDKLVTATRRVCWEVAVKLSDKLPAEYTVHTVDFNSRMELIYTDLSTAGGFCNLMYWESKMGGWNDTDRTITDSTATETFYKTGDPISYGILKDTVVAMDMCAMPVIIIKDTVATPVFNIDTTAVAP